MRLLSKYIEYSRDFEDVHKKDIEFTALLIDLEQEERLQYWDWFERQRIPRRSSGIDQLLFTIHRDYWNEGASHYHNGAISIRVHGDWLSIGLHREYMPHEDNLLEYVRKAIWYLMANNTFKLPLHKITYGYSPQGEVTMESHEDYPYDSVATPEQFADCIVHNMKLQQVDGIWERFEFKLCANRYSILRDWNSLLDGNYLHVLARCTPTVRRHCKKLGIDFGGVCGHLAENDPLKGLLQGIC